MTAPIGYYVHHHGEGHRQRALQIARAAPGQFVLLGTGLAGAAEDVDIIDLPDDRMTGAAAFDGRDGGTDRPDALHYAPLNHDGIRRRVATLTAWIAEARPALMVVDVSVEVAMLARLASVPTVCVRLNGDRGDAPHLEAFRRASALLCPYAEALDGPGTPEWVRRKTLYAPGLTPPAERNDLVPGRMLVVVGRGGQAADIGQLSKAARAWPAWEWRVAGPASGDDANLPPNLNLLGWTKEVSQEIARAEVVIGGAGNGLVTAVMAADRPFICLPEPRPFDEQLSAARSLETVGAAVVKTTWPEPGDWGQLVDRARAIPPLARRELADPYGPERTAARLVDLALSLGAGRSDYAAERPL
ncbi:MAG: glycosyltransferase [Alphaproteobacteria bacterium]|nr:MAG: glycosyltransferase [Alphaproteobacteria bacterium]